MSERQALIRDAITFLRDPKAQSSPLIQRVQFLEAKGLSPSEIDEAVRRAHSEVNSPLQLQYGLPNDMRSRSWDWRDYFITAVIFGSIMYGVTSVARKYLLPHLRPPTSAVYEADKDALSAQFDSAEAMLKEIQAQTEHMRNALEEQTSKIDQTTKEVDFAVHELRDNDAKTRTEIQEIREEIISIREMLPKMVDKTKDGHVQSMAELQQELKSLKALLLSRGPPSAASGTLLNTMARPSIPSWQLASSSSDTVYGSDSQDTGASTILQKSNTLE